MQLCNRIYYSTVHWRLNMFRAAYRSSSGALTAFAPSGLHTHVVTGCSQVWVGTQCNRIYYSTVHWSLNMFRAAYRSSSGAVCRSKHVEPSMNGGIINSVTKLHLVAYFYWVNILYLSEKHFSFPILSYDFFRFLSPYEGYRLEVKSFSYLWKDLPCDSLTLRLLMSYIYGAPILDVSRSHTTTQHGR